MASLVVGGIATLMSGGWVLPTGLLSAFAVATISRASFGFGLRHLVIGPIYGMAKLFLPAPMQVMLTGAEVVTSSALIVAGTGKAIYKGTRFMAGAAYLLIAGVISGTVVVLRLINPEKLEDTVDKIQCLASTTDLDPPVAVVDLSPSAALSVSTVGNETFLVREENSSTPQPSSPTPSSSSSSTLTTPPPPPPRLHIQDPSNPFYPTDHTLVDPKGSIADMSAVISSVDAESLPNGSLSVSSSVSFVSASLYPSLTKLKPELEFEDWVFVQSTMTEAQIRREIEASTSTQPPQEAVAQCSMNGLSTLLNSYKPDEIAEIEVFETSDATLEHPVQSLTLDQLRELVLSAQLRS